MDYHFLLKANVQIKVEGFRETPRQPGIRKPRLQMEGNKIWGLDTV